MTEEKSNFRWAVTALIGLLAAGGGIAAIVGIFNQPTPTPPPGPTNSRAAVPDPAAPKSPETPVKCKVNGTVYDIDKNLSPMPMVRVLLTGNQKDHPLGRTGTSGEFTGDCSQIPESDFPQRVKVVTPSNKTLTDDAYQIPRGGREEPLYLYVSETDLQKNEGKKAILKVYPQKQNPRIFLPVNRIAVNRN